MLTQKLYASCKVMCLHVDTWCLLSALRESQSLAGNIYQCGPGRDGTGRAAQLSRAHGSRKTNFCLSEKETATWL
jgi:hypothetical protein